MAGIDPYDMYPPGERMSTSSAVVSGTADEKPNTSTVDDKLITAEKLDIRRYYEIELDDRGSTLLSRGYDSFPDISVYVESKRVSVHPLGHTIKPQGFSESRWASMNPGYIPNISQEEEEERKTLPPKKSLAVAPPSKLAPPEIEIPPRGNDEHDQTEMPFLDHLEELRWALLKSIFALAIGMIVAWSLSDEFIGTITRLATSAGIELQYIQTLGPIMIRLQISMVMGIVIALPFIFYFIWSFISPGLYKREKKWVLPTLLGGTVCFFIGVAVAYFLILPYMLRFLKTFVIKDTVIKPDISDYISLVIKFLVAFGIIFELPVVSFILAKIGILKHTWMSMYRKYAIIIIFIVAAVITPQPDVMSQLMVAIPLMILYEISIIVAWIAGRKTILSL